MLDIQLPGKLDGRDLHPGFHLHMVPEVWQGQGKKAVAEERPGGRV